jgi:hypothetical protein
LRFGAHAPGKLPRADHGTASASIGGLDSLELFSDHLGPHWQARLREHDSAGAVGFGANAIAVADSGGQECFLGESHAALWFITA